MARNFKELRIWKESYNLVLDIYKVTSRFPEIEKLNLISEMNGLRLPYL